VRKFIVSVLAASLQYWIAWVHEDYSIARQVRFLKSAWKETTLRSVSTSRAQENHDVSYFAAMVTEMFGRQWWIRIRARDAKIRVLPAFSLLAISSRGQN